MKVKHTTLYTCETCGNSSEIRGVIERCERRGTAMPTCKIGDIVAPLYGPFGWYDGDSRWVENDDRFHGKVPGSRHYQFYYVVTHIDRDPSDAHRVRYHFFTKAMSERSGYRGGYNYDTGHRSFKVVTKPSRFLARDSRDLIGLQAQHLL